MLCDWLVAYELVSDPGHFSPLALFPYEEHAAVYLHSICRPAYPDRNYIIRHVDSEEDIYRVCNGEKI